jgi:hypothetical protein
MSMWLIWAKGPKGPTPQLIYDFLTSTDVSRSVAVHLIPDSVKDEVKAESGGNCRVALERLARRYPLEEKDDADS